MQGIAEGAAEVGEGDAHHVAFCEAYAVTEAEVVGAEEVNVDVAGPAMLLVFEVMMFEVGQRVAHVAFAAGELCLPNNLAAALDRNSAGHSGKIGAHDQLRSDGALAQLRRREVQVIYRFHNVIGKLIPLYQANAVRHSIWADQIRAGDFRLVAAILCKVRHDERLAMGPEDLAATLIKPFGRRPDPAFRRPPAFQ